MPAPVKAPKKRIFFSFAIGTETFAVGVPTFPSIARIFLSYVNIIIFLALKYGSYLSSKTVIL